MPPTILFVTFVNPFVFSVATSLRTHHLLKMLSKMTNVVCIAIIPKELHGTGDNAMARKICKAYVELELLPPRSLPSFLRFKPTETSSFFSQQHLERCRDIIRQYSVNMIWLDYIFFADYFYALSDTMLPIVVGTHNVESDTFRDKSRLNRSLSGKLKYFIKWRLTRRLEKDLARNARYFVTVSRQDREYYSALNPAITVFHLNSCINLDYYRDTPVARLEFKTRPVLLYTGLMKYEATYEAVLHFYNDIMPRLDRLLPAYTFYVVGKDPVQAVLDLQGPKVVVTGFVESTLPYFRSADVFVVPLLNGTGTRLKILEAMAAGIPVVTTTKGCEGLDVVDHEHVLIADEPEQFARHIVTLLHDADLRSKLITHARDLVRAKYDWRSLEAPLRSLLAQVLGPPLKSTTARELTR
jgi:glycosyltransferase involved in cell wall biosynthesis